MMKNSWDMLYLPDVMAYSLESRDGDFLAISRSLPYRWYGNTLRNNKRARALKNRSMWTSVTEPLPAPYAQATPRSMHINPQNHMN